MSGEFDIFSELGMQSEDADFDLSDDGAEELPEGASDQGVEDFGEGSDDEGEAEDDVDSDEIESGAPKGEMLSLLQEMRAEIASLREQVETQGVGAVEPAAPTEIDFVDDATFDNAVSSREGLNKLLNTVHQAGHASAMQLLPQLVREQAEKIYSEKMLVESFYRSNPDLDKVRPVVAVVAKEVVAEMPNEKDAKKIMAEVAKRTRARVGGGARGGSSTKHKNPGNVPSGAGRPGSGRPGVKKPENIAAEISKMMQL
jgi:hypothetical protein